MSVRLRNVLRDLGWKLTNLHASTETKDEVESRLLLNVVIGQSPTVFELLASENQTLLIRRNSFLVLDLALHVVDSIR